MSELSNQEINDRIAVEVMEWSESIDYDYNPPQIDWVNKDGGFGRVKDDPRNPETVNSLSAFCPATDIANAMEVAEKMGHAPLSETMAALRFATLLIYQYQNGSWLVNFVGKGNATADTLAKAICLAALAATGAKPLN